MKTNAMTQDKKYFVTSKVTCPECNGTGILSQLVRKQLQKNYSAVLSVGNQNTLIYEVSPGENNFTCLICDGSGHIKNDVPLKDALIETIKGLAEIEK
jgi:DnaJ-class molecular chaperone